MNWGKKEQKIKKNDEMGKGMLSWWVALEHIDGNMSWEHIIRSPLAKI